MKNAFIFCVLLLMSGAFIDLIVNPAGSVASSVSGDENGMLMWAVIDSLIILVCFLHGRQLVRVACRQPWILAFVGWAVLSVLWSDFPLLSVRRVADLSCTMALGFFLGMKVEMKVLLRLVAWAMAFTIPLSFIAAIFFPSIGIMDRLDAVGWRGVFGHKNGLGSSMGIAIIAFVCLFWDQQRNRLMWLAFLFPAVVLLAFSRSMTATIVTVVTICIGLLRTLRLPPAKRVALYAVALILALGATLYLQDRMDKVFAAMGRDSSLTGRLPLWKYSTEAVLQRPFLGAGWDGFWPGKAGDRIRVWVRWEAPHAHNSFIEMALNIGVIGLIIFLICVFKNFRLALQYSKDPSKPVRLWPLLFYTFSFLAYFTEAPAVDRHSLAFVLFCALPVSITEAFRMNAIEDVEEEEYMPLAIGSDSTMVQES